MWHAFRARAPAVEPSEELNWVLLRAFATRSVRLPRQIDGARSAALSRQLDLGARIATLHATCLADELGAASARELTFQRLEVIALDRILGRVAQEVAEVARSSQVPLVLLKHAALRRAGIVAEGERSARDVDVLVPTRRATEFQERLIARGFRPGTRAPSFHLPTLVRGRGEVVEIHHTLWGVRLSGKNVDANAEDLIEAGHTESWPDGVRTLSRQALVAHAIVHGLVQHRRSPGSYPSMRALLDLAAIGLFGEDAETKCQALIGHATDESLTRAAMRLSHILTSGIDISTLHKASPEFRLLSHVIAASGNDSYRRALRLEKIFELESFTDLRQRLAATLRSTWNR